MADAPKTPSSWYIVSCCILNYITAKHRKDASPYYNLFRTNAAGAIFIL